MTGRHDYPELVDLAPPLPVVQSPCQFCHATGWRETHVDDLGHGHGDRCWNCGGLGYVWTEVQS